MDRAPHASPQVEAGTLPQPNPACNPAATTLEHADAMLAYLRSVPAGYGHELARAMLASSTFYLRETFGQAHALAVTADLVAPLAGVVRQAGEDVGKPGLRIDVVELGGLDQRVEGGGAIAARVRTRCCA